MGSRGHPGREAGLNLALGMTDGFNSPKIKAGEQRGPERAHCPPHISPHTGSWCDWMLPCGAAVAAFLPTAATAAGSAQVRDGRG